MKCSRCQHENPTDARFCEECAAPLGRICTNCGTPVRATAKFCPACAHPLEAVATAPQRFSTPDSYTPKHLAERILTSRAALEGERKQVTVLFADLKGSMELLADRDPEEARKLLDPVLERMIEAVHRYEGTVNQVMGDGIMALFGAPIALEDHAVRACYAALAMQAAIKAYGEELRRSQGLTVRIRVGLNSGEVVVRAIGSDLRMDYTAVGQTTHLAARMEQLANPDATLLTAATLQLVEGFVSVKPQGPVPVKGLNAPVEVYELTGAGAARSRLQAAAIRGLTKFVGRSAELTQMHLALEQAHAGHGQLVGLVGEPGVGKSRLVWEFVHSHRLEGWGVLESTSVSYGKASAYRPVVDLLKNYFQIDERDDARRVREKVAGKLLMLDRQLEPLLSALLFLLDTPLEDAQWDQLDPPEKRMRIQDSCKRLLLREAQVQPLVLVFEDLHWIDSETQTLLDSLVESLPSTRVVLLVNYRPEYQHHWGAKTYYTQLRIDPLGSESAETLLLGLLGDDASLAPLKRLLTDRTGGNPLFLEEGVRTLVETGELLGARGSYRLAAPVTSIEVPATVQAILASRIDRLLPEDKRLLQAAAVIGKDVPLVLLQSIADFSGADLEQGLARLQSAEFLYEMRLFPDLEYTFKHALTHEVAYGSVLQERRRHLHGRIVEAIERNYPDRLAEHLEQLGHHAFRGELWAQAADYFEQAAAKALARSALPEAATRFEQALGVLTHLPQSQQTMEQAIDIHFELRNALMQLGDTEREYEHLLEAEHLALTLEDQLRLARVSVYLSTTLRMAGQHDQALESGQRALRIGEALGNRALMAEMDFRLGTVYYALGDIARARVLLRRRAELGEDETLRDRFTPRFLFSVLCHTWLGYCLAETGEFVEGIASIEKAIPMAQESDQPFHIVGLYESLAYLYRRQGRVREQMPVLERAFALSQAKNVHVHVPVLRSALGLARCWTGSPEEGLPLLEESAQTWQKVPLQGAIILANLGEGYLLAGRLRTALDAATRALDVACSHNERGSEAWVFHLLGEVRSHPDLDDCGTAEANYREALALSTELGMRPLVAHCHLGLGKLHQRLGQRDRARGDISAAAAIFREMDMRSWLEKAEGALGAL